MRIKLTAVTGFHGSQGSHIIINMLNFRLIMLHKYLAHVTLGGDVDTGHECNKITLGAGRSHERDRFERYPERFQFLPRQSSSVGML